MIRLDLTGSGPVLPFDHIFYSFFLTVLQLPLISCKTLNIVHISVLKAFHLLLPLLRRFFLQITNFKDIFEVYTYGISTYVQILMPTSILLRGRRRNQDGN